MRVETWPATPRQLPDQGRALTDEIEDDDAPDSDADDIAAMDTIPEPSKFTANGKTDRHCTKLGRIEKRLEELAIRRLEEQAAA